MLPYSIHSTRELPNPQVLSPDIKLKSCNILKLTSSSYSYTDNGGTILGITGDDFVVLAGDTRHTSGYSINSRTERKVYRLGEDNNLILATVGFGADSKDVAETMTRAVNVWIPCLVLGTRVVRAETVL